MALTRDFRETIRERAQTDPAYRRGLLREGLALCHAGDFATGRGILRNYINATIGFARRPKRRIYRPRAFNACSDRAATRAQNIFGVIAALQKAEGVRLELQMLVR